MRETESSGVKDEYHRYMHGKSYNAATAQIYVKEMYVCLTPTLKELQSVLILSLIFPLFLIPF